MLLQILIKISQQNSNMKMENQMNMRSQIQPIINSTKQGLVIRKALHYELKERAGTSTRLMFLATTQSFQIHSTTTVAEKIIEPRHLATQLLAALLVILKILNKTKKILTMSKK